MRQGGLRSALIGAATLTVSAVAQAAPSTGPLSLPETLRGTVRVPVPGRADARSPADTLQSLYPVLAACWKIPQGLTGLGRAEITTRFALRRDGSVIGAPRVTYAAQDLDTRADRILTDATLAAIRRCTPARITPALGAAIAGRPIALRFIYQGPKGQGV